MYSAPAAGGRAALPSYGPAKIVYNRFVRWAKRGIWEEVFSALAGADGAPDRLMIDSTVVKAHRSASGSNV